MICLLKGKKNIVLLFILLAFAILLALVLSLSSEKTEPGPALSLSDQVSFLAQEKDYAKIVLKLAKIDVETEVVFSPKAKSLGLSGRQDLVWGTGMLFVFNEESDLSFVMRAMNFPIDIVFIRQGIVEKIFPSLRPEGKIVTQSYNYGPADMVLELPSGYMAENNLSEGLEIFILEK